MSDEQRKWRERYRTLVAQKAENNRILRKTQLPNRRVNLRAERNKVEDQIEQLRRNRER